VVTEISSHPGHALTTSGTLTAINSTVSGNSAGQGGDIYNSAIAWETHGGYHVAEGGACLADGGNARVDSVSTCFMTGLLDSS
jgi:hypothetical protein